MKGAYIVVVTTFSDKSEAEQCMDLLLEKRLVACCQVNEIESRYHWNGRIERSKEWKVSLKSKSALCSEVLETIRAVHSYELPEIVVHDIVAGEERYLEWIEKETK